MILEVFSNLNNSMMLRNCALCVFFLPINELQCWNTRMTLNLLFSWVSGSTWDSLFPLPSCIIFKSVLCCKAQIVSLSLPGGQLLSEGFPLQTSFVYALQEHFENYSSLEEQSPQDLCVFGTLTRCKSVCWKNAPLLPPIKNLFVEFWLFK